MPADLVQYKGVGEIQDFKAPEEGAPIPRFIDVTSRLFKTGTHKGVPYTEEFFDSLVSSFTVPKGHRDWTLPIQLDHQDSARDTVGHIRGLSRDGDKLMAMLRFTGKANVEAVIDGNYKKLSPSFYVKDGQPSRLREASVTPFPYLDGDAEIDYTEEEESMPNTGTKEKGKEKESGGTPPPTPPPAPEKEKEEGTSIPETFSRTEVEGILKNFKDDFDKRTKTLEDRLEKAEKHTEDQQKVIKFQECSSLVVSYMEGGKTTPAMKEKELDFLQTLTSEQLKSYKELKDKQPAIIHFGVTGTADDNTDEDLNGRADSLVAKYFKKPGKEDK